MTKKISTLFIYKERNIDDIGGVLGQNDNWLRIYIYITLVVMVGFILLVTEGEYSEKSHVSGYLIPDKGLIKVIPNHLGLISSVSVTEGQRVHKDDLLFVIDVNSITDKGRTSDLIAENLKTK